jgi:signal transduction histidine kinase
MGEGTSGEGWRGGPDRGRGLRRRIPPAEQERLFDRLYRATTATENRIPGSGLGLTIVKAIVEAQGGSVSVESEPGRGSHFRVELPLNA